MISPLQNLFGKSPFGPLQKHMKSVQACSAILPDFFEAVQNANWDKAAELKQAIIDRENEADALKKELRLSLPKSLFMPVSRSDILDLLRTQDKIANVSRDIAGLVSGRRMKFPSELAGKLNEYLAHCVKSSTLALEAIEQLDELLETGFRGHEVIYVEKLILQLEDFENENDKLSSELNQSLFAIEKSLDPVDVVFLYELIRWLGDLCDQAQAVGSRLQVIIAQ
ncbi:TIGR00153 family protein [Spongiibacter pelagi]|uniref:TIGR00153 family protein n=1 Tax=Spongiibacter pelagi TaxID=2760804 RepID=UPI00295BEB48|nr:TIGR00153 family protein [Spongiibacter pelagi]